MFQQRFLQFFILLLIGITILIGIVYFCRSTVEYIHKRYIENEKIQNILSSSVDDDDDDDDDIIMTQKSTIQDIDKWLKNFYLLINNNNNNNNKENNSNSNNNNLCKTKVIQISDKDKDNNSICDELSQSLCDNRISLTKITIPSDIKISFYLDSGIKLVNGQSYCMHKPPPPLLSSSSLSVCNEVWGFWQFSQKYEIWMCKSKVPGIYNAEKNSFDDACKPGALFYDKHLIENISLENPESFYSTEYQNKFTCNCPKGYIFKPELSRTTCFKDPCLSLLPRNPFMVKGYNHETGNCECGDYYYNLDSNNPKSICTPCPTPIYNPIDNTLKLYIKCGPNESFPCITYEEKTNGCKETRIKIKPIIISQHDDDDTVFEELVFF